MNKEIADKMILKLEEEKRKKEEEEYNKKHEADIREIKVKKILKRIDDFFDELPEGYWGLELRYYDENESRCSWLDGFDYNYLTIVKGPDFIKMGFSDEEIVETYSNRWLKFVNIYMSLEELEYIESKLPLIEKKLEERHT